MKTIADIYNKNPESEWERLDSSAYNRLEFIVFMHHIKKHFPIKGLVLDAGGGPGRYTIELARLGFDVVLLDISSGNIDTAIKKISKEPLVIRTRIKQLMVADITDLQQLNDNSFDAVLCLDPLSCLADINNRKRPYLS